MYVLKLIIICIVCTFMAAIVLASGLFFIHSQVLCEWGHSNCVTVHYLPGMS